jgi:hypothetical protein
MKDFGQWLNESRSTRAVSADGRADHISVLEDAGVLDLMNDGRYMVRCCVCGKNDELPVDPSEIDVGYEHYCNGSPWCCP